MKSHLYVALDLRYIDSDTFVDLYERATTIGIKIGGLMRYLKNSGIRGSKFILQRTMSPDPKHETRNP